MVAGLVQTSLSQNFNPRNYQVFFGYLSAKGRDYIVIRDFYQYSKHFFVAVDPVALTTEVFRDSAVLFIPLSQDQLHEHFKTTPYVKALTDALHHGKPLHNAGITHLNTLQAGAVLTVDLCPSKHDLDKDFFNVLIDECGLNNQPVPVAISISGLWLKKHSDDFEWLVDKQRAGALAITLINHSYYHRVDDTLPASQNFLLLKGTNIANEILLTEQLMLKKGISPSPFFRFPGLVSSLELVKSLLSFGLIPIGADAWLAKNQKPVPGSIILLHANGNERFGLMKFYSLLKQGQNIHPAKRLQLLDLRESLAREYKN